MIKLLEAMFRRSILLLLILFVPIIVGLGIGYILPPSYQASATLWALRQYTIAIAPGGANTPAAPADTQTAALTELLQSSAFDIAVGTSTDLKSTLNVSDPSNVQAMDNAYVADISKNVLVSSKGNDLYQITYTSTDPHIAAQVVASVIVQFKTQGLPFSVVDGQTFSIIEGQHLLQGDQAQLTQAENESATAAKNENAYLLTHPGATLNDPQYAELDAKRVQAQSTVTNLQATVATLTQQITASQSSDFFKTLDPPAVPSTSLRSKLLVTTVGVGAGVGVVLCIVYMLIIVRRDRALYSIGDLQKVAPYPILMQVPQLPKASKELVIPSATRR